MIKIYTLFEDYLTTETVDSDGRDVYVYICVEIFT